jgi:hypothetical protein
MEHGGPDDRFHLGSPQARERPVQELELNLRLSRMKTNEIPSGTSAIALKRMMLTISVTGASAVRLPPSV